MGIQSTGVGSNLDVNGLISKLMQIEGQPLTTLAKKEASYQAKLSAYGSLSGAVSSFQSALTSLSSSSTFQNLTATPGDSSILTASTTSVATAGSYNINTTLLAQAQTISSTGQASTTTAIGGGSSTTVSFQFGTISGGTLSNGIYTGATYTQDATQATGSVTINSSNNSLQGIRDAINTANIGVSASIVGDGSATPYHLVLSSTKTGATSSLKISVSGDASIASLLNYDPAATQNLTQTVTGQNAALTVNGIAISSASNSVSGAIQGTTLSLAKTGSTTLNITANTSAVQSAINGFVTAYNSLNSTLASLTSYDAASKKGGILLGDSTTSGIQNQIRGALSTAVNGLGGGLTTLSQIGITFQKDGTLATDSSKLSTALSSQFSDIGGLFASIGKATDSLVSFAGSTTATKAGAYALSVSTLATQGGLTGDVNLNAGLTIAANTSLNVTIDGVTAAVSLAAGTYTSSQLVTLLQTSINGTSAFSTAGKTVAASINGGTGFLTLKSNAYGSVSNVTLANGTGTTAASFTGTVLSGTAGVDVAGSFNGVSAVGSGQYLTGASNTAGEGLKVLVSGGATGSRGTVNFSRGYAYTLNNLVGGFLGASGTITSTTNGVNKSIADIGKQRDILNTRLIASEARYRAQFIALDRTISNLNATSSFLTQQLSALTVGTK